MRASELKLKRYLQRKEKEKSAPPKSTSFLNSKAWQDFLTEQILKDFTEFAEDRRVVKILTDDVKVRINE